MPSALGALASVTQTTFLPSKSILIVSKWQYHQYHHILLFLAEVSRPTTAPGQRVEITKRTSPPLTWELPTPPLATTSMTRSFFTASVILLLIQGLRVPGSNWILHLRSACRADVRYPVGARRAWERILLPWFPRGQVFVIIIIGIFVKWLPSGRSWRKSQRSLSWCTLHLTTFRSRHLLVRNAKYHQPPFFEPKSVSQLIQFQGPLQVEEKWRDLYPYQVVLMCHQVVSGGIGWCQVVPLGGVRWCHQVILRCHQVVSGGGVRCCHQVLLRCHCEALHWTWPCWWYCTSGENRPWSETCKKWGIIISYVIAIWAVRQQHDSGDGKTCSLFRTTRLGRPIWACSLPLMTLSGGLSTISEGAAENCHVGEDWTGDSFARTC